MQTSVPLPIIYIQTLNIQLIWPLSYKVCNFEIKRFLFWNRSPMRLPATCTKFIQTPLLSKNSSPNSFWMPCNGGFPVFSASLPHDLCSPDTLQVRSHFAHYIQTSLAAMLCQHLQFNQARVCPLRTSQAPPVTREAKVVPVFWVILALGYHLLAFGIHQFTVFICFKHCKW